MQRLTLTPEQQAIVNRMSVEPTKAVLNASDVGTGKTITSVELVQRLGSRTVLVVCPLSTRVGWERTFKRQGVDLPIKRIDSTKSGKEALSELLMNESGVYLVGREYIRRLDTHKMKPDILIYDEVHAIQNRNSLGFKKLMKAKPTYRVALSATFARNKFEGSWAVTRWLWPDLVDRSFWRWSVQWCRTKYDAYAYQNKKIVGERIPGSYVAQLPCYVRLESKIADAVTEIRYVELTPAQRKMYAQMEEDCLAWLKENPLVAELPVSQRTRMRQMTLGTPEIVGTKIVTRTKTDKITKKKIKYKVEVDDVDFLEDCKSTKLDALKEILSDLDDEPVLILTDSQRFASVTVARLGKHAREWSGQTSQAEREHLLETFNKDYRYLVATIGSVAEGLDGLQHECANVVWLSKSEDGVLNQQALGRLVRMGQKRQVVSYEIVAVDTYDEGTLDRLIEQELEMRKVMRADRD